MTDDWTELRDVVSNKTLPPNMKLLLGREIAKRQQDVGEALQMQAYIINMLSKQYTEELCCAWEGKPFPSHELHPQEVFPWDLLLEGMKIELPSLSGISTYAGIRYMLVMVAHICNQLNIPRVTELPQRYSFGAEKDAMNVNEAFEDLRDMLNGDENE